MPPTPRAAPSSPPAGANALEILRETARILRASPSPFLATLFLLLCPVSALLLSSALVPAHLSRRLSRHLALLAARSGLPPARLLAQISSHLAASLLSSASCLPLLISLLLLARQAIAYSVACSYASRPFVLPDFLASARRSFPRLILTYIFTCISIIACITLFIIILITISSSVSAIGYPPEIVVFPALLILLFFSVAYAHTIIITNLAIVISVLEEAYGAQALVRSVTLIKGQTQAGLLIFLGSTIGMAFVEGLFEHRVKTLSYGDGSSRLWEGPLLVVMYSFVVLIDSMMSAVFYFTCRSSSMDVLSGDVQFVEEMEKIVPGLVESE